MKSVEPHGTPSTVARMRCPAVPLNGIEATGARGRDLARGVERAGRRGWTAGAEPMPVVPDMIACDLRW